ncbi:MAG: MFS transporter [Rhodospirillales bacterium]|nr:MFS transporter [Rhodospirillales bacterium]
MSAMSRKAVFVICAGCLIVSIGMGIRHSFGVFLGPMTTSLGLGRETFALALALQQIMWGLSSPLGGMVADRYGAGRVLVFGAIVYACGLAAMSAPGEFLGLNLGAGILIGIGLGFTGFSVVLGAVGRVVPAAKRSMAFGLVTAFGSFGQFAFAPFSQTLISAQGWPAGLMILGGVSLLMAPIAIFLAGRPEDQMAMGAGRVAGAKSGSTPAPHTLAPASLRAALSEASAHKGFWFLTLGFFVCGFQVMFIAVHFPSYVKDVGLSPGLGATALGLVGLFNIAGTFACGYLGGRYSKKYLLSSLYLLRALVFIVFLLAPKTEVSVLIFAASLGLLWLGTVPLTSGIVAQVFGPRYMSTLFGIVFLSHQVGSFLGVWLGGYFYDTTGSYDVVWIGGILLGFFAGLIHLPIAEAPLRAEAAQI